MSMTVKVTYTIKLFNITYLIYLSLPSNKLFGLLTKCEVKMAGYWPSSIIVCLWTDAKSRFINLQKKNEANI